MKTLSDFFTGENNEFALNNEELTSVRAGQSPPQGEPDDPWLNR